MGKTNAADAGTPIEAEPVSVELWSQVIDPTRDYFSEFMLPPHLPTNMSKLGVQSQSVVESGNLIPHSGRPYGTDTSRQRQDLFNVEYSLSPNWSAKVEYLHLDLGTASLFSAASAASSLSVPISDDLVRAGVNYHW